MRGSRRARKFGPAVVVDYGFDGGLVRFEVLRASKVVENAREMQFAVSA